MTREPAMTDLRSDGATERTADHFRLYFLAAVARVMDGAASAYGGVEGLVQAFPFLSAYLADLPETGWEDPDCFRNAIAGFESECSEHLPLRTLRSSAGLDHDAISLLIAIGLQEEDPRFGILFDAMQGTTGQQRATFGLLNAWWCDSADRGEGRARLRHLRDLGLVHVPNSDAPRSTWSLQVPAPIWDALRGETQRSLASWLVHEPVSALQAIETYVAPEALKSEIARIPALLASGQLLSVVVRGPRHAGRKTALGIVARSLGRGLLVALGLSRPDDERFRMLGGLALLLNAMPVLELEPGPGDTIELPAFPHSPGIGIVLPRHGGVRGPCSEAAITLSIATPSPRERVQHWQTALNGSSAGRDLDSIASSFRLCSGNIRRIAHVARAVASLRGSNQIELCDVARASQNLQRQALDTLATRMDSTGAWSSIALHPDTTRDLRELETRCRQREELASQGGSALRGQQSPGVRALLQGPSGTGKTLAARVLGAELQKDVYRVDLASVINKYIGETEKNLHQVFTLAEELDVILLLDEGDALLGQRTAVQSSTDRYANLETNYLLQRLEAYEGVVLITTNASDNIDRAFTRRMDVVIDFRAPDAAERHAIWQLHLPVDHQVDLGFLRDVAVRCAFSGGQIRNAVLHALSLATENGTNVGTCELEAAVQREYRKLGAVCPLRTISLVARGRG